MKAFKQINLNVENRIVFSYAAILCFLCSFIILNPLFGQEIEDQDSNKPEVKIDVQKEFDEQGNVIGYDSTYSWYWSGKEIANLNSDSIFDSFNKNFDDWSDCFKRNHFEPFANIQHPKWQWDDLDSSLYSGLDQIFDEEFMDRFNLDREHFPFHDSTIVSFFNFEEFNQEFRENQKDYMNRLRKYQEEHQQLIEKYFGEPFKENDQDIKYDQNKFSPKDKKVQSDKTGRI